MCNSVKGGRNEGQDGLPPGHDVLVRQAQDHEPPGEELLVAPPVVDPVGAAGVELITVGLDHEPPVDEEVNLADSLDHHPVLYLVPTGGQKPPQS